MYKGAAEASGGGADPAGPSASGSGAAKEDEVIDAEYVDSDKK
jgi:hypothetical protein